VLRVLRLLSRRFLERKDADHDAQDEEDERDEEPDNAPHLRWETATNLREGWCIRSIYFPRNSVVDYVPEDIQTGHDADEEHEESQYFASIEEPKQDDQTRHSQQKDPCQEIPPRPPKRKHEKHSEDEACDLARVGVEPARDERGAYQPRTEVPSREREPRDAAGHARRAALVRYFMFARTRGIFETCGCGWCKGRKEDKRRTIELDGVDVCACEDAHERVAHLVKSDREQSAIDMTVEPPKTKSKSNERSDHNQFLISR